jgi:hypothetical protein
MLIVLTVALPVFALIATGIAVRRLGLLGEGATLALNQFVVLLALPAVLLQGMAKIAVSDLADWRFLLAFLLPVLAGAGLVAALAARAGLPLANTTLRALAATLSNTGFMGIPLCLMAFGPDALAPIVISVVLTTCVQFGGALALVELATHAERGPRRALGIAARALARNPMLVAPFAGLALAAAGLSLPVVADRFLTLLGAAATPCALVAIGLQLGEAGQRFAPRIVAVLVAVKLLLQPAVAWLVAYRLLAMHPTWAAVAVIAAALPTGTTAFLLAGLHGREAATASGTVLVSTIASFVTLSVLLALLA